MSGKFQNINFDLNKLPPMPVVAARMIEMINAPNTSVNHLASVVSKDPAVSARVLNIANSSFYSMSRKVTTLAMAIVVLGERTLINLVLAASLRAVHTSFGHTERVLWEDSMVCALASRFLAHKLLFPNAEEFFMAGLFRHIGKVVINNQDDNANPLMAEMIFSESEDLSCCERAGFGATHAEIGAAVLEHWQLSEELSLVSLHHLDADLTGIVDQKAINMICLVNIASQFPGILGVLGEPQMVDLAALPGAKVLNLGAESLAGLFEEFSGVFEANREAFLG